MSASLPRRGRARRHRLSLIACFTAPGLISALADLFSWPEWVPLAAWVIALLVASQLVLTQSVWSEAPLATKAAALAAAVASLFWMLAMMDAPRLTVLALRGEPEVARVVDHDVAHYPGRGGGHDVHCYSLQRTDGTPIRGNICRDRDDEFTVGGTTAVLVDPNGLIAPETPDEVAQARALQVFGLVSLVATLVLCWVTGGLTSHVATGRLVPRRLPRPRRSIRRSKSKP
ncbi:hypothetical protein ACNAW0_30090 [Micromonospora sp. SL1-18]|uniref:hypothetical protein n=1 Tax=Micromonospora sp. SL1-18 TaxID=3399128 RepID=UPI003A4D7F39